MGKVKKAPVASKDEGQKKISSFFQKPSENPPAKLFSEVGTNSASKSTFSRKVSPPCSKAKENKSPSGIVEIISDAADVDEFTPAKKLRSPNDQQKLVEVSKKSTSGATKKESQTIKNASNDNIRDKETEVCVVPETQFIFTPESKATKKVETDNSLKSASDVFHSPISRASGSNTDFGIIPDTPDSSKIQIKPKKPLGRSFLLSASSFASNPIQKAKENREAKLALKKKRASLSKKGSVSVCVEFKNQNITADKTGLSRFVNESSSSLIAHSETSDNAVKRENAAVSQTLEISVDDTTPTKLYGNAETASVKRMAKSGISPAAKRSDGQNCHVNVINSDDTVRVLSFESKTNQVLTAVETTNFETGEIASGTVQNLDANEIDQECVVPFGDVIEFEKQRQERQKQKKERLDKRRLELLKERRRKEREVHKKNHEKLLNYQLTGNNSLGKRKSCKSGNEFKETVASDETLEDLLQELKSPSLLKHDSVPKVNLDDDSLTKPLMALNDDNCDTQSNCDNMTVLKSKLKETSKFESLDSNDSFGNIVAEWTDEDEKFFKKLGMSTEVVTNAQPDNLSDRAGNAGCLVDRPACRMLEDECYVKESKHANTLAVKSKTKERTNASYNSAHDIVAVNKDIELDIKEFQTQDIVKLSAHKGSAENDIVPFPTPSNQSEEKAVSQEEMEIDEFGSQLDSQLLCDEFEHLTPFKASKSDDAADIFQSEAPCSEFGRHIVTAVEHDSDDAADIFQSEAPCSEFGRHIVTAVEHDSVQHEMVLTLSAHPSEMARKCVLHGFWLDTHIQVGDIVNVLARFKDNTCHITDTEGLLVVNPDILLSGTTVVSSVFCMRKSILKEKFKGCDKGNIQMLYGSIIHSVFQQVLRKKLLTEEAILEEADRIVRQTSNFMEMYGNKVTESVVMDEIKNYLPQTIAWTKQHTNIGQDTFGNQRKTKPEILVTRVNDIEENIWSPRFGIKGKIDLTVETQLNDVKNRKIVPLELKTGKPSYSVEHKGQVTLYSMMCSDRREDPERGLLLYLKEPSMKVIPADHVNQKGLIQLRNEMVYYISRQVVKKLDAEKQTTFHLGRLPEPITNLRACQKCPQLINCAVYQREVEGRQSSGDGLSGLVDETLRHLTSSHVTYFTHWCLMLDLESQKDQAKRTVADIWCRSSKDREAVGECISGVVMTISDDISDDDDDSVIVRFQRHKENKINTPLSSIGINVQDSVVVSCEKPSWIAVCTGFVHEISSTEIQLLIDREGAERLAHLKRRVLRIDKCDNFRTAGMFYTNVSRLMLDDQQCQKLRYLIIDRAKPEFLNTLSKGNIEKVKSIFKSLNKPQKTSVLKVLMSKDYVLIKGYPGTGKTSTIVALVKVLSMLGHSVLLTSYTHSAVDNILLKLKKDSVKFLRLGRISKIHPDIREFSLEKLSQGLTTTAQLEEFLHSQNIVATSCLGTNHPLFTRRQFDVCIVDEASQVIQPACLGPLFCCQKFVLVGDPKQLPPVVQSKEARELGMDESLFVRLENTGATFDLNLQYRMNSDIMYLSNQMVYDGCLKCGSQSVAKRVLSLPNRKAVAQVMDIDLWMRDVLHDDLSKSVVFLDTEKVPAREEKSQARTLQNPTEARIVLKIVHALVMSGVEPDEIGIIAPYRRQVFLIRSRLTEGEGHWRSKVEVNTVDQYQGRDKSVIIISFVRSSEDQENMTGELLKDIRRLNVALTRAKVKLILIGNLSTLKCYPPLKQLTQLLEGKNQILQLPEGPIS